MRSPEEGVFKATVDQADRRLDRVLRGMFREVSLGNIMKSIRDGSVRVNSKKKSGEYRLLEGDIVSIPWISEERAAPSIPNEKFDGTHTIETLYKNDDIWCLDKPAGLLSQPDRAGGDSVVTRAWAELRWDRNDFRPSLIGRLDRNVSGVVAMALKAPVLRALSELMREGMIKKLYRAVVRGISPAEGEIFLPLYKDEAKNFVHVAKHSENAYDALTRFRRIASNGKYSLLEVELVTGRPHQARVHLSSIGHPIVGDAKYGDTRRMKPDGRLMLHAWSLSFPEVFELPIDTRGFMAISPIPEIFLRLTSS